MLSTCVRQRGAPQYGVLRTPQDFFAAELACCPFEHEGQSQGVDSVDWTNFAPVLRTAHVVGVRHMYRMRLPVLLCVRLLISLHSSPPPPQLSSLDPPPPPRIVSPGRVSFLYFSLSAAPDAARGLREAEGVFHHGSGPEDDDRCALGSASVRYAFPRPSSTIPQPALGLGRGLETRCSHANGTELLVLFRNNLGSGWFVCTQHSLRDRNARTPPLTALFTLVAY